MDPLGKSRVEVRVLGEGVTEGKEGAERWGELRMSRWPPHTTVWVSSVVVGCWEVEAG